MGFMDVFRKQPQEHDVELLGQQLLQLVESARAKNATELAANLSQSYARIYSKGNARIRGSLIHFTKTTLSDALVKLREPQMREVSPDVKMETHNACALEHMLFFTFLTLTRQRGHFPEIEELYQRELHAQTETLSTGGQSREVVADFAKVMDEVKKNRAK